MSRYEVEVKSETRTYPEAVIGYDPPLRTYFVTAFPDEETDEPYLWLGTRIGEYPSLEALVDAVRAEGFEFVGLKQDHIVAMPKEARTLHPPSAGERAGIVFEAWRLSLFRRIERLTPNQGEPKPLPSKLPSHPNLGLVAVRGGMTHKHSVS